MVFRPEIDPAEREALQKLFLCFDLPGYATLVDGNVRPCSMGEALFWLMEHEEDCRVGKDYVGDYEISTVFMIHSAASFGSKGVSLHFETMISHPDATSTFDRYATLTEAQEGHRKACEHVGWNL